MCVLSEWRIKYQKLVSDPLNTFAFIFSQKNNDANYRCVCVCVCVCVWCVCVCCVCCVCGVCVCHATMVNKWALKWPDLRLTTLQILDMA